MCVQGAGIGILNVELKWKHKDPVGTLVAAISFGLLNFPTNNPQ